MLIRLAAAIMLAALALQQQTPVFRTRVEIIQLDVSVLDKNRRPVRGLAQADFTVLEDGKPRPIVGFTSFEIDDDPEPSAGWMRDVPPDVTTNERRERRLFVLVMDDAMIPQRPAFIQDSKKIALNIIERFTADDFVAVIFTGDNRKTQDFTNDKTKLRAALDGFNPGLADYRFGIDTGWVDTDMHFYMSSVRTLSSIADYLISVPNRRKAIFWVSPGVPFDTQDLKPVKALTPGAASANPSAKPVSVGIEMRDLAERTEQIFQKAQQSNVVIYPIDPTGLGGMRFFIDGRLPPTDPRVRSMFNADNPGPDKDAFPQNRDTFIMQKTATLTDFLAQAASSTGGRTVMNTNDWDPGITEIFEENKSYYLIGFESASSTPDGRMHRVEVKVNRPNVDVRSRSTYYALKPEKTPDPKKPPASEETLALGKAIGGVLSEGGLPMRVSVAPFAVAGQRLTAVTVVLGVRQPVPAKSAERLTETTELQISAFTPEGTPRGTQRHTARVVIRPGSDGEAAYEVLGKIDLPPGRYSLRLAAHNTTSKKSGSVFTDVVVPPYADTPFSITPIVLAVSPGRVSAPRDLLTGVLPVVPTADRELATAQNLTAFMRLYQTGQKPIGRVVLNISVRDTREQVVARESRMLETKEFVAIGQALIGPTAVPTPPPRSGPRPTIPTAVSQDQFANLGLRTADVRYTVPIAGLMPGEYLLTFEATLGDAVLRRDLRFAVR